MAWCWRHLSAPRAHGPHRRCRPHRPLVGRGDRKADRPAVEPAGPRHCVALSPDGQKAFTVADLPIQWAERCIWDAIAGTPLGEPLKINSAVIAAAFSPDGKTLWTGDLSRARALEVSVPPQNRASPSVRCTRRASRRSPSARTGKRSSPGVATGTAGLWASATGKPLGLPLLHQHEVQQVAFSSDGKLVVTACRDGTWLWMSRPARPWARPWTTRFPSTPPPSRRTASGS